MSTTLLNPNALLYKLQRSPLGERLRDFFLFNPRLSRYDACLQNALGTHSVRGHTNFQCKSTSYFSSATGTGNHQPTSRSRAVQHFCHSSGALHL
jgi:hypothetical protein